MRPRRTPRHPDRSDRRYRSARWLRVRDRVLNRPYGPTPYCVLDPDGPPHLATLADHINPVYPGMPDAEFYDEANLQPACNAHNIAKGMLDKQRARGSEIPPPRGTPNVFRRRRP